MLEYEQAKQVRQLSREEELDLIAAWQENEDQEALDTLITTHMRLCYGIAFGYSRNPTIVKDLAQEGVFGIRKAAKGFDPSKEVRFSTWATRWIRNEIRNALSRLEVVVDVPAKLYMTARSGNAEEKGIPWCAIVASKGQVAIDAPVRDGSDMTFQDTLETEDESPEEQVSFLKMSGAMATVIADAMRECLNEREQDVIRRRWLCEEPETLELISIDHKISRERVRQIEAAAFQKLKKNLHLKRVKSDLI